MMYQLTAQDFDRQDPINIGRPTFFNMDKYLSCVEEMITCDEVQFALDMLNKLPGWYRDHVPGRAIAIRERLLKQYFTTLDYAKNGEEIADKETALTYLDQPHGHVLLKKCQELNDKHFYPHIEELGPGNYWVALGLKEKGIKFTYYGPSLNAYMNDQAKREIANHWAERAPDSPKLGPKIFVCFEMLEHLTNPADIYHHYIKRGGDMDFIFLSTPMYTFGGGMGDWYAKDLGHIRTYTPKEFGQYAMEYWPNYSFLRYDGPVMCIVGEKK